MLVFVDESGDTGFKLGEGSSAEFTIALIVFADNKHAEAASDHINKLRVDLKLSESTEFHFAGNSNEQRRAFLKAVGKFEFLIFAVVVNKAGHGLEEVNSKNSF